jgi:hypothetical protein
MRFVVLLLALLLPVIGARSETISLVTLNCFWFGADDFVKTAAEPLKPEEYSKKAGHLIGLLPREAPLFIGLQEIGNEK